MPSVLANVCSYVASLPMCCCHAPISYAVAYNEITIVILLHAIIIAAMHAWSLNIVTEWLGNTAWDNLSVIHMRRQLAILTTMVVLNVLNHSLYEHAACTSLGEQLSTLNCLEFTFLKGDQKWQGGNSFDCQNWSSQTNFCGGMVFRYTPPTSILSMASATLRSWKL